MGLSRFPAVMDAAVEAVLQTAEAMRYVRDAQGDLLWSSLDDIQTGLRRAKVTTYATFAEAAKQPASAEAHMASLGGPPTIAAYQAKAAGVEQAAAAWNAWLAAYLVTLPPSALIAVVIHTNDGIETKHIERRAFIPGALAAPLRASAELAALIEAFEEVGA
jgi:glutathione S-transferase